MARSNSIFSRVPIELPNRSGFDCSHENMGTQTTGTLVPVLVDELLPNDSVSLGANFQVQLPPMATDFYGRVDYVIEAFFVPNRLLWGGWQSFMTHPTENAVYPAGTLVQGKSKYLPLFELQSAQMIPGSLADYLGIKFSASSSGLTGRFNMLPFLAYHRIYDDWYRDSRIQSPLFYRPDTSANNSQIIDQSVSFKPFVSGGQSSPSVTNVNTALARFSDGVNLYQLRQRNWKKDYFTTASLNPQAGGAANLTFEVDTETNSGAFSIASLRSANSMQKWLERNNIAGYRYSDQIYAQYGIYPSDAIMDRVIYLGRKVQNVYTRSVFQTTADNDGNSASSDIFGGAVGRKAGSSQAIGECSLVDNFRATEHGFLFVLASLVPHANYGSGIRRYLTRKEVGDFAFPLLSGMGDQSILTSELDSRYYFAEENPEFGWTDLYAEYKFHDDEVHGLLRDGSSLEAFALQRTFDAPELSSAFLQIPKDYLDQVLSADVSVSGFSCWYDIYFPYKKVSTLPEFSLPTLADLKNTHKGHMSRGGSRL